MQVGAATISRAQQDKSASRSAMGLPHLQSPAVDSLAPTDCRMNCSRKRRTSFLNAPHRFCRENPGLASLCPQFLHSFKPKGAAPALRFRDQSSGPPPGKIDGEQQSQGIIIPFGDLLIGATALEVGYSILTVNV